VAVDLEAEAAASASPCTDFECHPTRVLISVLFTPAALTCSKICPVWRAVGTGTSCLTSNFSGPPMPVNNTAVMVDGMVGDGIVVVVVSRLD